MEKASSATIRERDTIHRELKRIERKYPNHCVISLNVNLISLLVQHFGQKHNNKTEKSYPFRYTCLNKLKTNLITTRIGRHPEKCH